MRSRLRMILAPTITMLLILQTLMPGVWAENEQIVENANTAAPTEVIETPAQEVVVPPQEPAGDPVEPAGDPVEPVEPVDPVEPEEPADPVEPVEPADDPVVPVDDPVEPVEPVDPVEPVEPETVYVWLDNPLLTQATFKNATCDAAPFLNLQPLRDHAAIEKVEISDQWGTINHGFDINAAAGTTVWIKVTFVENHALDGTSFHQWTPGATEREALLPVQFAPAPTEEACTTRIALPDPTLTVDETGEAAPTIDVTSIQQIPGVTNVTVEGDVVAGNDVIVHAVFADRVALDTAIPSDWQEDANGDATFDLNIPAEDVDATEDEDVVDEGATEDEDVVDEGATEDEDVVDEGATEDEDVVDEGTTEGEITDGNGTPDAEIDLNNATPDAVVATEPMLVLLPNPEDLITQDETGAEAVNTAALESVEGVETVATTEVEQPQTISIASAQSNSNDTQVEVTVTFAPGATLNQENSSDQWTLSEDGKSATARLSLGSGMIMPLAAPGSGDVSENFDAVIVANPTTVEGDTDQAINLSFTFTAKAAYQSHAASNGDFILVDFGAPFTPEPFLAGYTLFLNGDTTQPWATVENVGTDQLKITFLPLADTLPANQTVHFDVDSTNVWVWDEEDTTIEFDVTVGSETQQIPITATEPPVVEPDPPTPPSIKPEKRVRWADADDRGRTDPNQALVWTIYAPTGEVDSVTLLDTVQGTNWEFSCDPITGDAIVNGSGGAVAFESAKCLNGGTQLEITWGAYNAANNNDRPFIRVYGDILERAGEGSPETYDAGPFENSVQVTQIADRDGVEVDPATLVCPDACDDASINTEPADYLGSGPSKDFDWAVDYQLQNDGTVTGEGRDGGVEAIIWTIRAPAGPAQSVTITDSFAGSASAGNWEFVCSSIQYKNLSRELVDSVICDPISNEITVEFGPYTEYSSTPYVTIRATITDTQPANAREVLPEFRNCAVLTAQTDWQGTPVDLTGVSIVDRTDCASGTQKTPPVPDSDIEKTAAPTRFDNGEVNPNEAITWTIPLPDGPNTGVVVTDTAPVAPADENWEFSCKPGSYTVTPPGSVTVACTPGKITIISINGYDRGDEPVVTIKANLLTPFTDGQEFVNSDVVTLVNDYAANSQLEANGSGQGRWVQTSYISGGGSGDPNALVSVGDYVWIDTNRNGIQDETNTGVDGLEVRIYEGSTVNEANLVDTTVTAHGGWYGFKNLNSMTQYTLWFEKPDGYQWTAMEQGGVIVSDSNVDPGSGTHTFESAPNGSNLLAWDNGVATGEYADDPSRDAGLINMVSIGDYVWFDYNRDGQQDNDEPSIDGVTVELHKVGQGPVGTTQTSGGGYYEFLNLDPNTQYELRFTLPAGYDGWTTQNSQMTPPAPTEGLPSAWGTRDSDVNASGSVTFTTPLSGLNGSGAGNTDNPNLDAGVVIEKVSVGDYVWYDTNANGVQDVGEDPVPGVIVDLLDGAGNPTGLTATTDGNGYYYFTDLDPFTDYQLQFSNTPPGWVWTFQDAGGDDAKDSDVDSTGWLSFTSPEFGVNRPWSTDTYGAVFADDPTLDAGLVQLVSVGDYVWYDVNRDGVQDVIEPPVAGVEVTIYDRDNAPLVPLATDVTDANGWYSFTDLYPNKNYILIFNDPSGEYTGWTVQDAGGDDTADSDVNQNGIHHFLLDPATSNNLGRPNGEPDDPTRDAGLVKKVSIGDYVWFDDNFNGLQDEAADRGVEGALVELFDENGIKLSDTTTDSSGYYFFQDLEPNTDYQIKITHNRAGYGFTKQDQSGNDAFDSDADMDGQILNVTTPNQGDNLAAAGKSDVPTYDAGIVKLVSVGDYVWFDYDRDGVQGTHVNEEPIENVEVTLKRVDGSEADRIAFTDPDGYYGFDDLYPDADYELTFTKPANYDDWTLQDAGTDNAMDSDVDPAGVVIFKAPITPNNNLIGHDVADDPTLDAGLIITKVSIGDYVWYDENLNGIQNPSEAPAVGLTVTLFDKDGNEIGDTLTDANGYYYFRDLEPATEYSVVFEKPENYDFTLQDIGDDTTDSDADRDGRVTFTSPEFGKNQPWPGDSYTKDLADDPTIDAGLVKLVSVGDYVWFDENRDGVQGSTEVPVPNVKVTLYDAGGDKIGETTTDPAGYYAFKDLYPNIDYSLTFEKPDGYAGWTDKEQGGDPANDSNVDPEGKVNFTSPKTGNNLTDPDLADDPTLDAGLIRLISVGDYVWDDENRDGVQDSTEVPVPGVKVTLYDKDGNQVGDTTTDEDGYYYFKDLEPKTDYYLIFEKPDGYAGWTDKELGGDPGNDSNVDPSTGRVDFTTPDQGNNLTGPDQADDPTLDAGLVRLVSVGDYVWYDADRDGVQGADETPIAGVTVTISGPNGFTATTATDGTGYYNFQNLIPETEYTITFEMPDGYTEWTTQAAGEDRAVDSNVDASGTYTFTTPKYGNNLIGPDLADDPTIDAGVVIKVSVGDYVWDDENRDGVQDPTEVPVPGVKVTLYDKDGNKVGETTTDEDGYYNFKDLYPDTDYSITFEKPDGYAGWTDKEQGGDPANDSNVDPDGTVNFTTPSTGENQTGPDQADDPTLDAGLVRLVSVGDYVWYDADRDGVQGADETPIAGVSVTITGPNGFTATTATDETGYYNFQNLIPETEYTITFEMPDGYTEWTTQAAGEDRAVDSNVDASGTYTFTTPKYGNNLIGPDMADDPTIDAGVVIKVSVGDYVWFDEDKDGIQDPEEEPAPSVKVHIYEGEKLVGTTTTDEDGYYYFKDLYPNTEYTLVFEKPDGFDWTADSQGGDRGLDSDVNIQGVVTFTTPATGINQIGPDLTDNPTLDAGLVSDGADDLVDEDGLVDENGPVDPADPKDPVEVTDLPSTGSGMVNGALGLALASMAAMMLVAVALRMNAFKRS